MDDLRFTSPLIQANVIHQSRFLRRRKDRYPNIQSQHLQFTITFENNAGQSTCHRWIFSQHDHNHYWEAFERWYVQWPGPPLWDNRVSRQAYTSYIWRRSKDSSMRQIKRVPVVVCGIPHEIGSITTPRAKKRKNRTPTMLVWWSW